MVTGYKGDTNILNLQVLTTKMGNEIEDVICSGFCI
jgi:hypothetical protein